MSSERYKSTCVVFINSHNQVLLFLRDDKAGLPFPNCWDIPGGSLEADESPEQAICREMREEIEIDLENPQLFRVYEFADRSEYVFWKRANFNLKTLTLNEGQGMAWFSESDIRKMSAVKIAFGFKSVLLDFYTYLTEGAV